MNSLLLHVSLDPCWALDRACPDLRREAAAASFALRNRCLVSALAVGGCSPPACRGLPSSRCSFVTPLVRTKRLLVRGRQRRTHETRGCEQVAECAVVPSLRFSPPRFCYKAAIIYSLYRI